MIIHFTKEGKPVLVEILAERPGDAFYIA